MTDEIRSGAALRPLLPADMAVLAAVFQASVEDLTAEDYDEAQRAAWASAADEERAFGARLAGALTLVATLGGAPVGFISLAGAGEIDMLYVYPETARQGIGTMLLRALQTMASARGATKLTVAASDTSRPFFERHGFAATHRQTVAIAECWLGTTQMEKTLVSS